MLFLILFVSFCSFTSMQFLSQWKHVNTRFHLSLHWRWPGGLRAEIAPWLSKFHQGPNPQWSALQLIIIHQKSSKELKKEKSNWTKHTELNWIDLNKIVWSWISHSNRSASSSSLSLLHPRTQRQALRLVWPGESHKFTSSLWNYYFIKLILNWN